MPFSTVKPLLVKGAGLLRACRPAGDSAFAVCARGMACLAGKEDAYRGRIVACAAIVEHFTSEAHNLVELLECPEGVFDDGTAAALQESALALVEDMALIVREKHLRCGCRGLCEDEDVILTYFENSGFWKPGDGGFATDMYYVRLPVAVMYDFVTMFVQASRKA